VLIAEIMALELASFSQQVCTASVAKKQKVLVAASWFKWSFKYLNWLFVASS